MGLFNFFLRFSFLIIHNTYIDTLYFGQMKVFQQISFKAFKTREIKMAYKVINVCKILYIDLYTWLSPTVSPFNIPVKKSLLVEQEESKRVQGHL